ncbi:MAG TPA: hypothetical protein VE954_40025 [Oligoflexus sp.]|uniref:hypothetical protein n=1 Tax=Oligoflexus sp. TaxID=1971216 RepID=UPI002D5B858A|nr:hypothetical protein [Oligoflexus sp.]HYX39331.1 hypothetical protein [Oligoflexus sp.]
MNFTEKQIYREWVSNVSARHTLAGTIIVIVCMAAFACLDFVAFEVSLAFHFLTVRICLMGGLIGFIGINILLQRRHPKVQKRVAVANMIIPVIALNFTFLHFVVHTKAYPVVQEDLLKGTIVTLIVTYAAIGKFHAVTRISCFINIVACIIVHLVWNIDYAFRSLIQYHVVSFFVFSVIHRHVKSELLDRFNAMKRFLPTRAAYEFVTTSKSIEDLEDSKLKERFTVFVVSDWRSYQILSKKLPPDELAKLFNDFYSIVFRKLPDIVPDLTYYISWTADEHRVAFYSNDKSDEDVMRMAVRYVDFLTLELPRIIRESLTVPIIYDVGVSSGRSVTGLQGPEECAQYSISGEHPGIAKRLETEAAQYRRRITELTGRQPEEPIAILTAPFTPFFTESGMNHRLLETTSSSADTLGLPIIVCLGRSVDPKLFPQVHAQQIMKPA